MISFLSVAISVHSRLEGSVERVMVSGG